MKCKELAGRIYEAEKDEAGRTKYPVVIISQGLGNLADRNYYSESAIKSGVSVYEGRKAYFDHPTETSERERPNRSVRELAGHYENVKAEKDDQGLYALKADFVPISSNEEVQGLLDHAIQYKKKYPDKDYVGISINGDGEGEEMQYDEFIKKVSPSAKEMEKISKIEGRPINVIMKLTDAVSADLVTEPGARGRVLLEQESKQKRRTKMLDAFKKLFKGLESNDEKAVAEATKEMMGEGHDKEKKESEDETEMKKAHELAKHLMMCKKEMKKGEDESEESYEAKCMAAAMKQMKKSEDEAKQKQDEGKKGEDEGAEKKEAGAPGEQPGAEKPHDDEKQDIELIKKMMGKVEKMEAEIESLKKGHKQAEDEAKKHHESEVSLKMKLDLKERAEFIDRTLAESGLPRAVSKQIRPVIEKCRTKDEIKETVTRMVEAHSKAVEEILYTGASAGFVEKVVEGSEDSTDKYF
jgi:hypothetical protein